MTILANAPGAAAPEPEAVYRAWEGTWLGALEYRDYTSDARVKLPTLLSVTCSTEGDRFSYVYDDGNGKVVRDEETVSFDPAFTSYSVRGDSPKPDLYSVASASDPDPTSHVTTIVLTGAGVENGMPVDVRETLSFSPSTLVMLRETKPAGSGAFAFRHRYAFSRISAPAAR